MSEQRVSPEELARLIIVHTEPSGGRYGPDDRASGREGVSILGRTALDLRDARAEIEKLNSEIEARRVEIQQVSMLLRREREWRQRAEAEVERLCDLLGSIESMTVWNDSGVSVAVDCNADDDTNGLIEKMTKATVT